MLMKSTPILAGLFALALLSIQGLAMADEATPFGDAKVDMHMGGARQYSQPGLTTRAPLMPPPSNTTFTCL